MKLEEIKDNKGARKAKMRIGRGIGSGKGKTSGRGGKGQTARAGVAINSFEGGQTPLYRRLPKRGFKNIFAVEYTEVTLAKLQAAIDKGTLKTDGEITPCALMEAGVIKKKRDGVKLLGGSEFKAKVNIVVNAATKGAIAAVEKAGGSVTVKCCCKAPSAENGQEK